MKDVDNVCIFFDNIIHLVGGNIAIYGMKEYAKLIGTKYPESVAGFLDRDKVAGTFLGKPVLTLADLQEQKISTLVIAASVEAEAIVYERIHQECERIGVKLYGLHSGALIPGHVGKLLSASDVAGEDLKKYLLQEITQHDVISFDVFDTLLMRRVLYPTDVFDIVGIRACRKGLTLPDNFKDYRMQAEIIASPEHDGLDGIYRELRTILNLTTEEIEQIRQLEIAVERDALLPRPDMLEVFAYARELGKQIILASDMYLPSAVLLQLLEESGYVNIDKIYVSDELGVSKQEGLFRLIRQDYPEACIMHIGDNYKADVWPARCCGIDVFPILSSLEMFRASGANQSFRHLDSINERLLVGLFVNHAFGSPFGKTVQNGKGISATDFTKLFIAPLAVSFIIWLVRRLQGKPYEAVLFAARDGYLLLQMYECVIKKFPDIDLPNGVYFQASRRLCIGSSLANEQDLLWLKEQYGYDIRDFLRKSLGIALETQKEDDDVLCSGLWRELLAKKDEIFRKSLCFKERYKSYMNTHGISPDGCYILVDFDSRGTTQKALRQAFWSDLPALYFHRWISQETPSTGKMESFLPLTDFYSMASYIMEFIFSSPLPSAIGFSDEGDILLGEECRSQREIEIMFDCQDKVLAFLREFLTLFIPDYPLSRSVGQQLLELYSHASMQGAAEGFLDLSLSDDFAGESFNRLSPDMRP